MQSSASHLLPGVPLVESPFFDQIVDEGAFDPDTLRVALDLRRDGYAVLDFPDADFSGRADRIQEQLKGSYDWAGWQRGERDSLRVQDAWKSNDDVKAIALNPRLLELLSKLYGRRAFPFQTINFPVGTQQQIHSDTAHFTSFPERFMCGVWVALEDIGPDQGPLVYYPGTQRWPVYTNEHLGVNSLYIPKARGQYEDLRKVWDSRIAAERLEPARFLARKGQALIWAANLLHGGDRQNNRSLTRWSQVTHYFFDNCSYFDPLFSDPFAGKIHFRDVVDVSTGAAVPHQVGGEKVSAEFINYVNRKPIVRAQQNVALPADFDGSRYLKLNPDVAAAGVDPQRHYLEFGAAEGRPWH